jgi:putative transposase
MFAAQLETVRQRLGIRLYAWVLMPEHFHLLLLPNLPETPLSRILHALKQPLARRVGRRLWQPGGGYDRNIYSNDELFEKARYIEFNPVRRGLVQRVEAWAWSSARWHMGDESGPVRIDEMPR